MLRNCSIEGEKYALDLEIPRNVMLRRLSQHEQIILILNVRDHSLVPGVASVVFGLTGTNSNDGAGVGDFVATF